MATLTITNNIARGFQNKTSGTKFTWFGTSFNMPVTNIFDNNSSYDYYEGMLDSLTASTSYDLTGFQPGWEICACSSVFTVDGPFAGGTLKFRQVWKNPAGTNYFFNGDYNVSFPSLIAGQWAGYQIASNTGCASWEVYGSGTYKCYGIEDSVFVQNTETDIVMSNVPTTSSTHTPGYVWIEGNNFAFISASGYKHLTVGTDLGNVGGTPGFFWVDGLFTYWIGGDGHKYKGRSCFKQFASAFSNGATGATYAGTGNTGKFWIDNQFGQEHAAFIASDGYKYLFPSGSDPYS